MFNYSYRNKENNICIKEIAHSENSYVPVFLGKVYISVHKYLKHSVNVTIGNNILITAGKRWNFTFYEMR